MVCLHPITIHKGTPDERVVPCGKCLNCLANRRAEWIARLKAEYHASSFGLFVTLTNDDEHMNYVDIVNESTGEVFKKQAPDKRTIQLFLKRLRKKLGKDKIRYFIISEYGDHTLRSHYHGLFFFKDIPHDKYLYDIFNECWHNGFIKFGDITDASITYVTKYTLKLSGYPLGINDNFMLCSRRPAIGSEVIMHQMEIDNVPKGNITQIHLYGMSARLPRLYRDKLAKRLEELNIDIEEFKLSAQQAVLNDRNKAFQAFKQKYPQCNVYDFQQYLEYNNELKSQQMSYRIKPQNLF